MTTKKDSLAVGMLLSAISSAVTYDDRSTQMALVCAGMDWANAKTLTDELNAWRKIEILAKWRE